MRRNGAKEKGGAGKKGEVKRGRVRGSARGASVEPGAKTKHRTEPAGSDAPPNGLAPRPSFATSQPHLSIAVVGAGRLGTALARALAGCGYEVKAVVARRAARAHRAASLVDPRPAQALGAEQLASLPPTDILFITTPDDVLADTAARLAAELPAGFAPVPRKKRARVALHASGALTSEALAPLRARGFSVGSLHPLASITIDAAGGAESLRRAFYCVEGEAAAVRAARNVVRALGAESFTAGARDKALYHAAAVTASGHTVALFDLAARLLARCGLSPARSRRVLLPLLESTVRNLSAQTPARALTGSFARGDTATIRRHLDALRARADRAALLVYALLGEESLRLAAEAGAADREALAALARLLAEITGKS